MPYTQADLDAVRAAIASGERRVEFRDRSVTYRSIDELQQVEATISRALATGTGRPKQTVIIGEKGL